MAEHEIIKDDDNKPVEARVTLDDGRVACEGLGEGAPQNEHIPDKKRDEIKKELKK